MWKKGRGEEDKGGGWSEGGRVIKGGEEQRLYGVWEGGVTFPFTVIGIFSFWRHARCMQTPQDQKLQSPQQPHVEMFSRLSAALLLSSWAGPPAAWPVLQVHSPGNAGPH